MLYDIVSSVLKLVLGRTAEVRILSHRGTPSLLERTLLAVFEAHHLEYSWTYASHDACNVKPNDMMGFEDKYRSSWSMGP
jgi:hypothetical protein